MKPTTLQRVTSIDVLRALTMLLMLFVNDIASLTGIPHWLEHADMHEDMLGFSDLIFPAFLFCMGMSISFAVQNRYRKGDTHLQVLMHIGWRTVALIAMGLFSVNSGGVAQLSHAWFSIIMVIGFFLTWGVYPKAEGRKKALYTGMKAIGIALLGFLVLYKGMHGQPFEQKWWGILGLIGWTYLICALIYLVTRESLKVNSAVWVLFVALTLLNHAEVLSLAAIPSDITLHTFGLSGLLTSLLMQQYASKVHYRKFIGVLALGGVVMLLAGWGAHSFWIISKIQATPTWLFFCLALFFPLFGFFYWLTDVKGKAHWFDGIKPAGTATLTCYVIPYVWYGAQQLLGWHYPKVLTAGIPGLWKSMVFSLVIIGITALLIKINIKLKV